jgi:hypothetical protein
VRYDPRCLPAAVERGDGFSIAVLEEQRHGAFHHADPRTTEHSAISNATASTFSTPTSLAPNAPIPAEGRIAQDRDLRPHHPE